MNPVLLLLVEDDPLIREVLDMELGESGFEVVAVHDGVRALAALDAEATKFKALITDIKVGGGPDGWAIGRRARELVTGMPVVYISGDSGHEWSSKGVPGSVLLAKPFVPAQLVTAISLLITAAGLHGSHLAPPPG